MEKQKLRKWIARVLCLCLTAWIAVIIFPPQQTKAETATDTLIVAVGYWGMDLSDYAIAGSYFWGELEANLPMYEQAYSFYRSSSETEYVSIVDSAYGFLVEDLLDYANINQGDIYNIMFYADKDGYQQAFDYGSLFCTRYYFENVALHRKVHYGTKEVVKEKEVQEPSEVPTEPSEVPTEPGEVPTEPSEVPTEPNEVPTEPSEVPTNPEEIPTEPSIVPTESETEAPTTIEENPPIVNVEDHSVEEIIETYTETVTDSPKDAQATDVEGNPIVNADDDQPGRVTETYTETVTDYSRILGYSFDECWNYSVSVRPMLAIEDNWTSFTQEFESIGPNFNAMSTNNRFRLLFGQTSPTETMTSASVKNVNCIYITLYGSPVIGEMPELNNKLGSHEVTVRVKVNDISLIKTLSEYMRINSTNENVMIINNLVFSGVEGYSNLVDVTISYEIVGNGTASFTANYGGTTGIVEMTQTVDVTEAQEAEEKPGGETTQPETSKPSDTSGRTGQQESRRDGDTEVVAESEQKEAEALPEEVVQVMPEIGIAGFRLSDSKAIEISLSNSSSSDSGTEELAAQARDIDQVKLEDSSEDNEKKQRKILLWTGVAAACMCTAGATTEILTFRRRLHSN